MWPWHSVSKWQQTAIALDVEGMIKEEVHHDGEVTCVCVMSPDWLIMIADASPLLCARANR